VRACVRVVEHAVVVVMVCVGVWVVEHVVVVG
jgi:hypothetical protein